ncbi:MAG TPA: ABC transporter ATP-binding protein, partial [Longimicrobiaceae bacterium]|nr:ABC transporter ATP-binding protein [Longimicrobiaceae bacterium]
GLAGLPVPAGAAGGFGRAVAAAFGALGITPTLGGGLALYVGVMSVQALAQRAQTVVAYSVELETALRLRVRLYRAIAAARWTYLARQRASDLVHALTHEIDRVGAAASYLLLIVVQCLLGVVYLLLALRISATVTGVAVAAGAVLLLALRRWRRDARAAGAGQTAAVAEVMSAATEHLQGMKLVKSYAAEDRNAEIFATLARRTTAVHAGATYAYADARAAFTIGSVLLLAVATWLAIGVLHLPGALAILLVFLFSRLVPRLSNLQTIYQHLLHALPAFGNVLRRIEALEAEGERAGEVAAPVALRQAVRLEGVSFGYGGDRTDDAVRGLDLEIAARRTTALVGPSGAGKTTVADLVMGLALPREGRIGVDGRALDESWMRAWREGIGYVAQDTLLFHDTVLANLRWARPEATEEEVWEALRLAAAEGFVAALPQGLETVVGDRGVRLSGGERQRLALARALLRRPTLLILDEATSALDTENERRIRAAIGDLQGKVGMLLITHRLASVRDADTIYVLEEGRVVEHGGWVDLMARGGRFHELWRSQEGGAEPLAPPPAGVAERGAAPHP